jgi:hypothetical protein
MENLLLKKLQIKPHNIIKVEDAPVNSNEIFGVIPADVHLKYQDAESFNVLILFSKNKAQLNQQIKNNLEAINAKTIFWVFYPKKSSKIESDLDLMNSWKDLQNYNLAPCASAAINETWTALRLKLSSEIKASGVSNEDIKKNLYGAYIDVENKLVKLPEDLKYVLELNPSALNYYNQLSYSNKKEYVLWILTAKQEKTRLSRIDQTLELLLANKKNPSDKN